MMEPHVFMYFKLSDESILQYSSGWIRFIDYLNIVRNPTTGIQNKLSHVTTALTFFLLSKYSAIWIRFVCLQCQCFVIHT